MEPSKDPRRDDPERKRFTISVNEGLTVPEDLRSLMTEAEILKVRALPIRQDPDGKVVFAVVPGAEAVLSTEQALTPLLSGRMLRGKRVEFKIEEHPDDKVRAGLVDPFGKNRVTGVTQDMSVDKWPGEMGPGEQLFPGRPGK